MFRVIPVLLFTTLAGSSFARTDTAYSYLRRCFEPVQTAYRTYVRIKAEQGNRQATDIYNLKAVQWKEPDLDDPGSYWYRAALARQCDSILFQPGNNAFRTITEGLNFLSEQHWQLFLIEQDHPAGIPGSYTANNQVSFTGIPARPVYLFRQKLILPQPGK